MTINSIWYLSSFEQSFSGPATDSNMTDDDDDDENDSSQNYEYNEPNFSQFQSNILYLLFLFATTISLGLETSIQLLREGFKISINND